MSSNQLTVEHVSWSPYILPPTVVDTKRVFSNAPYVIKDTRQTRYSLAPDTSTSRHKVPPKYGSSQFIQDQFENTFPIIKYLVSSNPQLSRIFDPRTPISTKVKLITGNPIFKQYPELLESLEEDLNIPLSRVRGFLPAPPPSLTSQRPHPTQFSDIHDMELVEEPEPEFDFDTPFPSLPPRTPEPEFDFDTPFPSLPPRTPEPKFAFDIPLPSSPARTEDELIFDPEPGGHHSAEPGIEEYDFRGPRQLVRPPLRSVVAQPEHHVRPLLRRLFARSSIAPSESLVRVPESYAPFPESHLGNPESGYDIEGPLTMAPRRRTVASRQRAITAAAYNRNDLIRNYIAMTGISYRNAQKMTDAELMNGLQQNA